MINIYLSVVSICGLMLLLGDSWSHSCTNRIILYWNGDERYAYIDKSPSLRSASAPFSITRKGIRNSASNYKRIKLMWDSDWCIPQQIYLKQFYMQLAIWPTFWLMKAIRGQSNLNLPVFYFLFFLFYSFCTQKLVWWVWSLKMIMHLSVVC